MQQMESRSLLPPLTFQQLAICELSSIECSCDFTIAQADLETSNWVGSQPQILQLNLGQHFLMEVNPESGKIKGGIQLNYSIKFCLSNNSRIEFAHFQSLKLVLYLPSLFQLAPQPQVDLPSKLYSQIHLVPVNLDRFKHFYQILLTRPLVQQVEDFKQICQPLKGITATSFGKIFRAFHKKNSTNCAVKSYLLNPQSNQKTYAMLMNQFSQQAKIIFPGIIKIYQIFATKKTIYAIMKLYQFNLRDFIAKRDNTVRNIRAILKQLLETLVFLNQKRVVHRNIVIDNILINELENEELEVVLTDFKTACRYVNKGQTGECMALPFFITKQQEIESEKKQAAEEMLTLGRVFFFMLTGREKIPQLGQLQQFLQWNYDEFPLAEAPPQLAIQLLFQMLEPNYTFRISAAQALGHEFLADIGFESPPFKKPKSLH